MNDLIMFDKMSYTRRIFLLSIITIMIYQLIDVTMNYLQYPTILKSDLKYFESGDLPSLTFCPIDYDWDFVSGFFINEVDYNMLFYNFTYNMEKKVTLIIRSNKFGD